MKKTTITESKIVGILKSHEQGVKATDLAREHGVSTSTLYNWRAKYGGMEATSELKRLKELEDENRRMKSMYAELSLDHQMLKIVPGKK